MGTMRTPREKTQQLHDVYVFLSAMVWVGEFYAKLSDIRCTETNKNKSVEEENLHLFCYLMSH